MVFDSDFAAPKNTISYEESSERRRAPILAPARPPTAQSSHAAVCYDNVLSREKHHRPKLRHQNSPLQPLTRGHLSTAGKKPHKIRSLSDDAAQAAANATHHHDLNVAPDALAGGREELLRERGPLLGGRDPLQVDARPAARLELDLEFLGCNSSWENVKSLNS